MNLSCSSIFFNADRKTSVELQREIHFFLYVLFFFFIINESTVTKLVPPE